jgi:transcriptional regulator with XRE-family HTH domain
MPKETDKLRLEVVEKVRRLRQENKWTQDRLARLLGLSQNRLSEIERGRGSFTAEQFLLILKTFNAPLSYFSSWQTATEDKTLQNALARLGASHLQESRDVLPTEKLEDSITVIREVLTSAASPRQITALAPVIVKQPNPVGLNKLRLELFGEGRINRVGWLYDSVLQAVGYELHANPEKLPKKVAEEYNRTEVILGNLMRFPWFTVRSLPEDLEDPLEADVLKSKGAFEEAKSSRDDIAKKWHVVTRIKTDDFIEALRGARENY